MLRILSTFTLWMLLVVPVVPEDRRADVALALAIDVSYSVDGLEHRLQMEGFADALQSEEVMHAIRGGRYQRIAVMVYQWSDGKNQRVIVPWTMIGSEEDAAQVSKTLWSGRRDVAQGGTAISAALLFGAGQFANAPAADRLVIDLATDGRNNIGSPVSRARDEVVNMGITINGLAISNEWKQLASYLEKQVIGGDLSFAEDAKTYDDFGATMLRKLVREITGPGMT